MSEKKDFLDRADHYLAGVYYDEAKELIESGKFDSIGQIRVNCSKKAFIAGVLGGNVFLATVYFFAYLQSIERYKLGILEQNVDRIYRKYFMLIVILYNCVLVSSLIPVFISFLANFDFSSIFKITRITSLVYGIHQSFKYVYYNNDDDNGKRKKLKDYLNELREKLKDTLENLKPIGSPLPQPAYGSIAQKN